MNKILLIQIDGKMPNLALMKISTYHKKKGDEVKLFNFVKPRREIPLALYGKSKFDYVYISCIFTKNRILALDVAKLFPDSKVFIGGSGINYINLPGEIEHLKPDYDLYKINYSMGFTSRGCIRKCPWCVVPEKEGKIRDNAHVKEFMDKRHEKLVLLDNNFLASPNWERNLKYIVRKKIKVNFNQGLDIRLIEHDNLVLLKKTKYYNASFKGHYLTFAWDLVEIEEQVIKGVQTLFNYGFKKSNIRLYILCGYDTTLDQDLHRAYVLREFGIRPFAMPYNGRTDDKKLNAFVRWVNRPEAFMSCDFKDYTRKVRK